MKGVENRSANGRRPLRLWPGVVLVALQWLVLLVLPRVAPDAAGVEVIGVAIGGLGVAIWWLFASRAPWIERIGALLVAAGAVVVTYRLAHPSIATGGMGVLLTFYAIPVLGLALVVWAWATRRLAATSRRLVLVGAMLVACLPFVLVRTGGFTGDLHHEVAWRWAATPEDRLLEAAARERLVAPPPAMAYPETGEPAETADAPPTPAPLEATTAAAEPASTAAPADQPAPLGATSSAEPATADQVAATTADSAVDTTPATPADTAATAAIERPAEPAWPGFRGPRRDGVVHGTHVATDWTAAPPTELWRRAVGPGWSSFAVDGGVVYTQEQRGEEEVVSCYRLADGEPVWRHADPVRFWESNAGAGPRATPTLHDGRLYALGATGVLNALDARDGSLVWRRDTAADTAAEVPHWGFSGSPLVVGELVIVPVSGRLVAYHRQSGERRWLNEGEGGSYSSPQLATLGGVEQVLFQRGKEALGLAPGDGSVLWRHPWPSVSIVQPELTADGEVLLSDNDNGVQRIAVTTGADGWQVAERWTTIGLKPYFNHFVVHHGHAYGFDGFLLAAIDLADGKRRWKGGRYGNGQLVLLADQDLLLVVSEKGELALVEAKPDGFHELARLPAIEGKTWNHPVLVGDVLLVRNDREMAAFRLATTGG